MKKNTITHSRSFMFSPLVPLVHACPRSSVPVPARLCPSPHVRACPRPRSSVPIPARSGPSPLVPARPSPSLVVRARPRSPMPVPTRLYAPVPELVCTHLCLCMFIRACICGRLYAPALILVRTRCICTRLYAPGLCRACGHARLHISI